MEPQTQSRARFASPDDIVADPSMTREEKTRMLESWAEDLERRLVAESEGMGAQNPMSQRTESSLADQLSKVGRAIQALDEPQGSD